MIAVAREYVAQFSPQEIESLPELCRPVKFFDANDIAGYAFVLVRNHYEDKPESAVLVHKLAGFFPSASIRLSQIMSKANASQAVDSRQSA